MGLFNYSRVGFAPVNVNRQVSPAVGPSLMGHDVSLPRSGEPAQPQQPTPPQGGFMSPSMGLFQAYMRNLFQQKYAPPMMQGSPLQNFGGFYGFGSPMMPKVQTPQQSPSGPMLNGLPIYNGVGPQPVGPYYTPPSQV